MQRLFVAVNLAASVNAAIVEKVLVPGRALGIEGLAWARPENLHITIKFLGLTDAQSVPIVKQAMRLAAKRLPVRLVARGVGAFPRINAARVVWVGIEDVEGALKLLASELDIELGRHGFASEEREYSPHLTIARVRLGRVPCEFFETYRAMEFGRSQVTELVLYESQTLPSGPRYAPVEVIRMDDSC